MPTYLFSVYEVDSSYYHDDAQSLILSQDLLEITDSVDDDLHRTVAEDPANDQSFDFVSEPAVTDYTVEYLDFAQVNGSGPEYELYAMEVEFSDGSTKYYVMSKDENFDPEVGDDLSVTTFSSFTSTTYGEIGSAVCYSGGTPILTDRGDIPVEYLSVGDLVQTRDNGLKQILWIGRRDLGRDELLQAEKLRPVLIREGAFGNPEPLLVSQQHRILVKKATFGECLSEPEAFVKAKHLAEFCRRTARIAHGKRAVSYFHILLDGHEVIFADGVQSESLFPGPMAIRGVSRKDRREIETLFPDLPKVATTTGEAGFTLARPDVPRKLLQQQAALGGDLVQGLHTRRQPKPAPARRRSRLPDHGRGIPVASFAAPPQKGVWLH